MRYARLWECWDEGVENGAKGLGRLYGIGEAFRRGHDERSLRLQSMVRLSRDYNVLLVIAAIAFRKVEKGMSR